jgi:hypothetical protein
MPTYDIDKELPRAIDTGEVISLYLLLNTEGRVMVNTVDRTVNSVGDYLDKQGKAYEDVMGTIVDISGGKTYTEVQVIFSTKEVGTDVVAGLMSMVKGLNFVEDTVESVLTCQLNRTREKLLEKHGYVG